MKWGGAPWDERFSSGEPPARDEIEEVGEMQVGLQPDRAAGGEGVPLAEHRGELAPLMAARDEGVGAGRLDDRDLGRDAAVGERQVLGPGAEDDGLAVDAAAAGRRGEPGAVGELDLGAGRAAA